MKNANPNMSSLRGRLEVSSCFTPPLQKNWRPNNQSKIISTIEIFRMHVFLSLQCRQYSRFLSVEIHRQPTAHTQPTDHTRKILSIVFQKTIPKAQLSRLSFQQAITIPPEFMTHYICTKHFQNQSYYRVRYNIAFSLNI